MKAPCLPQGGGPHHHIFELYAVDQEIDLTPQATRADVMKAIEGNILGASACVGVFQQLPQNNQGSSVTRLNSLESILMSFSVCDIDEREAVSSCSDMPGTTCKILVKIRT